MQHLCFSRCYVRMSFDEIDVIHKLSVWARSSVFALNWYLIYDRGYCFKPRPSVRGADGGKGPQGGAPGCVKQWPACRRPAARGREAHGANSCHGETLTPLNAPSGKQRRAGHMPVGEPGWGMGEEGERGEAADAVEKGELTPVKWLIKVRWSPFWWGGWGSVGKDSERNSKPSLANGALCRPQAWRQGILLFGVFTEPKHTVGMKRYWQMLLFSYPKPRGMQSYFLLSAG